MDSKEAARCSPVYMSGALIVGAGPSGLAAAAALKIRGISSLILEKEDCIGSLWKRKTYDRLHLHIPKKFCSLPHLDFPPSFPEYPSRYQVVEYLDNYADNFQLKPLFSHTVVRAARDDAEKVWRVWVKDVNRPEILLEYVTQWLVIASGENCVPVYPDGLELQDFNGIVLHSSEYKNGFGYSDSRVLVVGSGNSGMEIALDLANFGAQPSLAVRGQVHILPRDILGISTFSLTNSLLKLKLPKEGPMEVKLTEGKTPVLDVGTLRKIKSGHIKVFPGVSSFNQLGATFLNGETVNFDVIILATGYRSNVCTWLEGGRDLFNESGHPKTAFPGGWKGENGLFAAGLTRRGLQGACHDAEKIADDIQRSLRLHDDLPRMI